MSFRQAAKDDVGAAEAKLFGRIHHDGYGVFKIFKEWEVPTSTSHGIAQPFEDSCRCLQKVAWIEIVGNLVICGPAEGWPARTKTEKRMWPDTTGTNSSRDSRLKLIYPA